MVTDQVAMRLQNKLDRNRACAGASLMALQTETSFSYASQGKMYEQSKTCLLYTSDAADDYLEV